LSCIEVNDLIRHNAVWLLCGVWRDPAEFDLALANNIAVGEQLERQRADRHVIERIEIHIDRHIIGDDTELVGIAEEAAELARGIEPPTCGLQNPSEANLPTQQAPDKIGESLDGSQD